MGQLLSSNKEDKNFFEWLCGFTDGDASFMIAKNGKHISFRYAINLHVDDIGLLNFIQERLGMGNVFAYGNGSAALIIKSLKDIGLIINIFTNYPLKTCKYFDFIDFAEAYRLYTESRVKTPELVEEILTIKGKMNSKRSDYETRLMGVETEPRERQEITLSWLLGFVEAEGCFFVNKANNFMLEFVLGQGSRDLALMKAMKSFFNNLIPEGEENYSKVVNEKSGRKDGMIYLHISRIDYITKVLIPSFDNLTWHSKKAFDYQSWKTILDMKNLGLHYTEEGLIVINLILTQMNSYRLTTSKSGETSSTDKAWLSLEVEKLLKGPSNYEERKDGRIWIKSLNRYLSVSTKTKVEVQDEKGNLVKLFDSMSDCAKYLGVARMTVTNKLRSGQPVSFQNKLVYIKENGHKNSD